jgi:phosphoglycolate phosphatase-like HAD superfamily hydrolase
MPGFYRSSRFINAPPVPGAVEALQGLLDVGCRLIIVTARSKSNSEQTEEWLDRWFKGECPF